MNTRIQVKYHIFRIIKVYCFLFHSYLSSLVNVFRFPLFAATANASGDPALSILVEYFSCNYDGRSNCFQSVFVYFIDSIDVNPYITWYNQQH